MVRFGLLRSLIVYYLLCPITSVSTLSSAPYPSCFTRPNPPRSINWSLYSASSSLPPGHTVLNHLATYNRRSIYLGRQTNLIFRHQSPQSCLALGILGGITQHSQRSLPPLHLHARSCCITANTKPPSCIGRSSHITAVTTRPGHWITSFASYFAESAYLPLNLLSFTTVHRSSGWHPLAPDNTAVANRVLRQTSANTRNTSLTSAKPPHRPVFLFLLVRDLLYVHHLSTE